MLIPYYSFGILYLVILAIFLFFLFLNMYHLVRFGFFDFSGKISTFLFISAWVIIFFFTWLLLKDVNWLDTFDMFGEILGDINLSFLPE
ncbi:MAG: hypothetical protein WC752_04285 [Patescibacteria group bacterium]|jgi:hypothetical protein